MMFDEYHSKGVGAKDFKEHDLLVIPGVSTLTERLSNPSFLTNLRQRRLEYVKSKVKTSRKSKRAMSQTGEEAPSTRASLARITTASGTSESDKKLASELAQFLKQF
jgi:hypothetical protein